MKITIIGAGSVGATTAYTIASMNLASEIILIDINQEKSIGEALDIRQGLPFFSPCSIYAGDYSDAKDSDIVVLTSGVARKPGQTRLDLAQVNVNITKTIIPQITKYAPNAKYIIVANPVDILTYVFFKQSGLPTQNIIGSGTILDTARLKARLSQYYNVSQKNVHAYVLGEHGDSSFVPWSIANISNVPVAEFENAFDVHPYEFREFNKDEIENYVRTSGAEVIARKGATFYAVSAGVCYIIRALKSSLNSIMTVSTLMNGEYGISDCCMSLPNILGQDGVQGKVKLKLSDEEIEKLRYSEQCLKNIINNIEI